MDKRKDTRRRERNSRLEPRAGKPARVVLRGERSSNAPYLLDNMQVWVENNYNTRLLYSNLAFPLLKKLTKVGDPLAKRVFKEEVVKRFLEGPTKIRDLLCYDEGYIDILTKEERRALFEESDIEVIEELEMIAHDQFSIVASRLDLNGNILWKDGKVSGLDLTCASLSEIPEQIKKLKDLEILILYAAPNEELPDWLSELKYLRHLDLQVGKLKSLPEWIGELKSLEHLDVYKNKIEYIPDSIGDLNRLKYLNLMDNSISTVPDSIGKLTSLEYLNLSGNKLELIPESIGNLKRIKELYLGVNSLESIPESIGNLKLLKELGLVANKLKSLPKSISRIRGLKAIYLSNNPLEDIPEEIINIPSLRKLWLNKTNISKAWYLKNRLEEKGVDVFLKSFRPSPS
ncbi:MAG: leucine-rich repeat domain-containing protein [Promethearchaeota archaeon]|nr:MAG: leucine-rich repeat domain-containing protein [Candidatus Lokiarchaeota archaeon]